MILSLETIQAKKKEFQEMISSLDLDQKKEKIKKLNDKVNSDDFWQDRDQAVKISKELENLKKELAIWEGLEKKIDDIEEFFLEFGQSEEEDENFRKEIEQNYQDFINELKKQEFSLLFGDKYDAQNVILSIHAGTGGIDAQDWAAILERMILRFSERKNYKVNIFDRTIGMEAGIKSVVLNISGDFVYGNLKSENGVHRLVRISPFDAEAMRHTSFALIEVIPEIDETEDIDIKNEDLKIDTFRSQGAGGQHVNTTDSAVRLTHLPSGIIVKSQSQRSQHQNKETAMKVLKSKLKKLQGEERDEQKKNLKGGVQKAIWGKQIRSYVMQPYKMVKDHRTNCETQEIEKVLDGDLDNFIHAFLKSNLN